MMPKCSYTAVALALSIVLCTAQSVDEQSVNLRTPIAEVSDMFLETADWSAPTAVESEVRETEGIVDAETLDSESIQAEESEAVPVRRAQQLATEDTREQASDVGNGLLSVDETDEMRELKKKNKGGYPYYYPNDNFYVPYRPPVYYYIDVDYDHGRYHPYESELDYTHFDTAYSGYPNYPAVSVPGNYLPSKYPGKYPYPGNYKGKGGYYPYGGYTGGSSYTHVSRREG